MRVAALTCLAIAMLGSLACSEDAKGEEFAAAVDRPAHEIYREWHDRCLEGTKKEIEAQIEKFEGALDHNPDDELARAYLGSAYALRAKAGFFGPSKLLYLNKAKKKLNEAVEGAPLDLRVRTVRAIAFFKVPERFDVRGRSLEDFEFLYQRVTEDDAPLMKNEKQVILYYAYLAFKEAGHKKAAEARKRCHRIDPNSEYGKLTA